MGSRPKESGARRRSVLVGLAALLLVGVAAVWISSGPATECRKSTGDAEPEIARRAEKLLTDKAVDEPYTVDRSGVPDPWTLVRDPKRTLGAVWHVKPREVAGESESVVVCGGSPPLADTVQLPKGVEEASILSYSIDSPPLSWRLGVQVNRKGDKWYVGTLSVLPSLHRGRSAEDFERLADTRAAQGQEIDALIGLMAAELLGKPYRGIETVEHTRIVEKLQKFATPETTSRILSREKIPRENDFFNVTIEVREKQGLLPVFAFVSTKRGEATREDGRAIFAAVEKLAPGIREDFAAVAMDAYEEPPIDPSVNYRGYRTLIDLATPNP